MADAAAYEAEDSRRKARLELHGHAEMLAHRVDEAYAKYKKQLADEERAAVKADLANLRKCLRKDRPDKMDEGEAQRLAAAKEKLEQSAAHLMCLYRDGVQTDEPQDASFTQQD